MSKPLTLSVGQFSSKGRKAINQDFYGSLVPSELQLNIKGAALALADGISSSEVSQIASEIAVKNFLNDYFCTSDTWSVQTSGARVLQAINGWLNAQTQNSEYRFNHDKGYVCTFSALILKGSHAHLFHVGDSRIYRIRHNLVELLTKDHRSWTSNDQSYLSRALGVSENIDIDYVCETLQQDDVFLLCTDGVYEYSDADLFLNTIAENAEDLDFAAEQIVSQALKRGSNDNLTLQIVQVKQLPNDQESTLQSQLDELPIPSLLQARQEFDGYVILRELHANSRSHVYLAEDQQDGSKLVIKIPSVELRDDNAYLERFLMEEWVARRINNAHVMKAAMQNRKRNYLYTVTEFIDGTTLHQWLIDHPKPSLETVRTIIEQIAKGLQAMHRMEILHQDLRPNNILIEPNGTVKIIDFGGVRVSGLVEASTTRTQADMQGTALYMAPEYFVGEPVSFHSDQFSLAVIAYHMLSGRFPYGTQVAKARTISAQKKLVYQSVLDDEREIPAWVDYALRKALQPIAHKRYVELSEFLFDLRHPNAKFMRQERAPLLERNPLLFWKSLSFVLLSIVLVLLFHLQNLHK